jgi:hypothetical protein
MWYYEDTPALMDNDVCVRETMTRYYWDLWGMQLSLGVLFLASFVL